MKYCFFLYENFYKLLTYFHCLFRVHLEDGIPRRPVAVYMNVFVLILILLPHMAQAETTMSLDQCIALGMENNPKLQAARADITSAEYGIKSVRADFLPSLFSGVSISQLISRDSKGPSDSDYMDQVTSSCHVKLSQTLLSGFRIIGAYKRAKEYKQYIEAQAAMKRLELVYDIKSRFYILMKAKEDVVAQGESVSQLTESLNAARAFFEKELVPYVDVLQAQVDLSDAQDRLGIARNNVLRERALLFSLMNLSEDENIIFHSSSNAKYIESTPDFDDALSQALASRPDIKALSHQLNIARRDVKTSFGKYLPTVRLEGGYYDHKRNYDKLGKSFNRTYDRDQQNQYWSWGVNASWTFFDGGKAWYERRQHQTQAMKMQHLLDDAKRTIATGIKRALLAMGEAQQRMKTSRSSLDAAREYYEGEEKRLKAGISTIPALLTAHDRLTRARGNTTRARLDYQLACAQLELMLGKEE